MGHHCKYCMLRPDRRPIPVGLRGSFRVSMRTLGKRVLSRHPETSATRLLSMLCQYGASQDFADKINSWLQVKPDALDDVALEDMSAWLSHVDPVGHLTAAKHRRARGGVSRQ